MAGALGKMVDCFTSILRADKIIKVTSFTALPFICLDEQFNICIGDGPNAMERIARFELNEILPLIGFGKSRIHLTTSYGVFSVRANSTRLECFRRNLHCYNCNIKGGIWILERSANNVKRGCFIDNCQWCIYKRKDSAETPHLNLYAFKGRGFVLMTQDHVIPKSAGGADNMSNLRTMCWKCNQLKGSLMPQEFKGAS